ncbi:hypothetical protein ACHAPV_005857 [Trichoderma viride]
MSAPAEPHSCDLCQTRLTLTFGNYYSDQGWFELIEENYHATGEAYVFNIAYEEAISLADQGCELFKWFVTLRRDDTHSESYLRAYFAHNSREQMVLDWVDELDDHIDGGTLERKLIPWVKDMPYAQLPQTLKDAIQVTLDLGLQHLWVDALCIIQDSNQDKAEQISRMADIYEQAHVTISAARATAVPEGFLHSRYIAGEQSFRMPFTCEDGQPSAVILWQGREPDAWEPIDKRSWCLQESILSPRVLEYGTHNIRYHCARSRADESQLQSDGWVGHSKTFAQLNMSHPLTSSVDWASLDDPDKFVQVWQTLVSHYTRRGLGWYQDKLLAISAIARKMSRSANKTYIAGLWAEYLGELLLWHPNHDPDAQETPRRHATYVAPSWSWGSFSGEIDFTFGASLHLLELVSYKVVTTMANDEFSAVTAARLEIKTLLYRARMRKGFYGWSLWDVQTQDEVDGSMRFDVAEDAVDGEVAEDEQVLLALVMSQDALLLKKAQNTSSGDVYTRIGVYREGQRSTNRPQWEMGQVVII